MSGLKLEEGRVYNDRQRAILAADLREQIDIARSHLAQIEKDYRTVTGWGLPSFRQGTVAAIIMEHLAKHKTVSITDMVNRGLNVSTVHNAMQKLMKTGHVMRDSMARYRKKV